MLLQSSSRQSADSCSFCGNVVLCTSGTPVEKLLMDVVCVRRLSVVQVCQSLLHKLRISLWGYSVPVLDPGKPGKVVRDQYLHSMVDPS